MCSIAAQTLLSQKSHRSEMAHTCVHVYVHNYRAMPQYFKYHDRHS